VSSIVCPLCGDIARERVQIHDPSLRRQRFSILPIRPTCRTCGSELSLAGGQHSAHRHIIVLTGTCACGKSAVAEHLQNAHGYMAIDGDCVMQVVKARAGRSVAYDEDAVFREIQSEIDFALALGYDVALSHMILPAHVARFREILDRTAAEYRIFVLHPNLETAIARSLTRTCHASVTPEKWVVHFHERMRPFLDDHESYGVTLIDNSDQTLEQTVARVLFGFTGE